jgi:hypothetical protein
VGLGTQIDRAETTVDLVAVIAILAVVGYVIYKFPDFLTEIKKDLNAAFGGMFSNPGGDETAGTAETYTGALGETASDPVGTLGAIVGYTPDPPQELPPANTTPGLPPGYNPSTGTIDLNLTYNGGTQ